MGAMCHDVLILSRPYSHKGGNKWKSISGANLKEIKERDMLDKFSHFILFISEEEHVCQLGVNDIFMFHGHFNKVQTLHSTVSPSKECQI